MQHYQNSNSSINMIILTPILQQKNLCVKWYLKWHCGTLQGIKKLTPSMGQTSPRIICPKNGHNQISKMPQNTPTKTSSTRPKKELKGGKYVGNSRDNCDNIDPYNAPNAEPTLKLPVTYHSYCGAARVPVVMVNPWPGPLTLSHDCDGQGSLT